MPSSGYTAQPMLPSISTLAPSDAERPTERLAEAPDERARAVVASRSDREHDELVPTDARDRVRFADDGFEAPRERLQHDVACPVPADVVDVLEPVEVDRDQRERLARAAGAPKRLLDAVVEQHAVRQAGEWIAESFGVRRVDAKVEEDAGGGGDERAEHERGDDVVRASRERRR